MIAIGLGSGRSGTASLAALITAQPGGACFHEMNPVSVRHKGTPRPILNGVAEFKAVLAGGDPSALTVDLSRAVTVAEYDRLSAMKSVSLLGDIAHYYLSYVGDIHQAHPDVRFICLKRDRAATLKSWLTKTEVQRWPSKAFADRIGSLITREHYYTAKNPWMDHDGSKWLIDPVWDKCFPKFDGPTREEAVAQYYDYYYARIDRIAPTLSGALLQVETETLNDRPVQDRILDFIGVPKNTRVYVDAHRHRIAS